MPHTHVVLALAGGDELRFVDARRFGWVTPGRPMAGDAALAALGPDPLTELDAPTLAAALAAARTPIKAFLLDQRRIAGLGNIYVAEALFRVGAHPATPARRLARRADELLAAVRAVLESGIARRGTTLRDYVDVDGRARRQRGRAAGLWPRRRTLLPVRHPDSSPARQRAGNLLLPALPASLKAARAIPSVTTNGWALPRGG